MNPIAAGLGQFLGANGGKAVKEALGELTGLLDEVLGGEEERERRARALELMAEIETTMANAESAAYQAYSAVLIADAQGNSWAQRNWRPVLNLSLGGCTIFLLIGTLFGFPIFGVEPVADTTQVLNTLLGITGIIVGAYTVARSWDKSTAQKTAATVATAELPRDLKAQRKMMKARGKVAARLRKRGFSEAEITAVLEGDDDEE